MKRLLPGFLLLICMSAVNAQITTPVIKAGFGVDGDLKANFYSNMLWSGNDDWFSTGGTGGTLVIDTTGAAAIAAAYAADPSPYKKRMSSFYRSMRVAPYTVVNNRLWLDALFVRDYHGTDTTVFVQGSSKNGMSPADWGGTIQSVPDKNEILDMMMHLRRAGDGKDPSRVDSLWFYGGLSIENTSGDRYFDFELYQTDIYYDRTTQKFYGYGPDAGHTSWKFDAAGNILRPGDIIFSASYQSSKLTGIEARIWIDKASMNTAPAGFNWTGVFDGAGTGAQYGYAAITPKAGATFYTGLENSKSAWAGPFQLIRSDNSIATDYLSGQFMEFSVNLTTLGIDPANILGGDVCGTPFNRMVVKTRASQSFTSALKDFVAPIDLFLSPRVAAATDVPLLCGASAVSELKVVNPSPSSVYTWTTTDGNIVGNNTGSNILADAAGTYIVKQQLAEGCNPYAYDTLLIVRDLVCTVLADKKIDLQVSVSGERPQLTWTSHLNDEVSYYEVETSSNGSTFAFLKRTENQQPNASLQVYRYTDAKPDRPVTYYRIKAITRNGIVYSRTVSVQADTKARVSFAPNPASYSVNCLFDVMREQRVRITVFNMAGKLVCDTQVQAAKGRNVISINDVQNWSEGMYTAVVEADAGRQWSRLVVQRTH